MRVVLYIVLCCLTGEIDIFKYQASDFCLNCQLKPRYSTR